VKTIRLLILLALLGLTLFNTSFAGKYTSGYKWQTYSLRDIEVYYPDGFDPYAIYMANRAIVHLDALQSWYGIRPKKTRIVLNPALTQGNAMAIVQPLRVELHLTPVLEKGLRPQAGLYLDRVLAHELTHVMQFSKVAGITKLIRPIFGDAIAPLALGPDWMSEGQAIWTESQEGGGRLNSSYHKMLFRTPLIEGKLWNLTQASQPGLYKVPSNRAYVTGSFMYREMISNSNGYGNAARWMHSRAKYPGLNGFAFKQGFHGRKAKVEFDRMTGVWRSELRNTIFQRRQLGFANGLPLLSENSTNYRSPIWMDNSTLAVYEKGFNRPNRIIVIKNDADFADIRLNKNVGYAAHNGITKFEDGILFSRVEKNGIVSAKDESLLKQMRTSGKTDGLIDGEAITGWAPSWNENTNSLAFINRTENGGLGLFTKSLNEPDSKPELLLETKLGLITDPEWNMDGDKIAFSADMGENEFSYIYDLESDEIIEVRVSGAKTTWDPTFAPNGNLWVSADFLGIFDLFEIDLEANWALRRTRVLTGAVEPAISPDGENTAYVHYTSEGFDLAIFNKDRWASDTTSVSVQNVGKEFFNPEWPEYEYKGKKSRYVSLLKAKPRFWLPWFGGYDEDATGVAITGRDPLGLLSWNTSILYGEESEEIDFVFSTTYRGLPLNITGMFESYPEDLEWNSPAYDTSGTFIGMSQNQKWERRDEGSVTLFQSIYMDNAKWYRSVTPFGGYITRERYALTVPDYGLESVRFNGYRGGFDFSQYLSARRDPVVRHYFNINISGEAQKADGRDLTGDVVEGAVRWHIPGPIEQTVLAFYGDFQKQTGPIDFSRNRVNPRGYDNEDLSPALYYSGRIAKFGVDYHFPIIFPDFGLGLGWIFMNSISGNLFAEGATGWGSDRDLMEWFEDDGVSSFGAEIGFGGRFFYNADFKITLGSAYRTYHEDVVYYFKMGFPSPLTGVYDNNR